MSAAPPDTVNAPPWRESTPPPCPPGSHRKCRAPHRRSPSNSSPADDPTSPTGWSTAMSSKENGGVAPGTFDAIQADTAGASIPSTASASTVSGGAALITRRYPRDGLPSIRLVQGIVEAMIDVTDATFDQEVLLLSLIHISEPTRQAEIS